jgi:DNA-binding CsgD family transcriptional regulator
MDTIDRSDLEDLVRRVSVRSDDIVTAAVNLDAIARERGFQVCTWDDISSKEPMTDRRGRMLNADVFGWTSKGERWWENHRLALTSRLARACRYESEPFWANSSGYFSDWRNDYLTEMEPHDFRERSLCRAVIIVPVHLPFGQVSANSLVPLDRQVEDLSADFARYGSLFGILIRRFVTGYTQTHRGRRRIPSTCVLTKREVECLTWAAAGKTDHEIGSLLGLSHATIRYHMRKAGEKLDAVNRSQAIFKASQLGYLKVGS